MLLGFIGSVASSINSDLPRLAYPKHTNATEPKNLCMFMSSASMFCGDISPIDEDDSASNKEVRFFISPRFVRPPSCKSTRSSPKRARIFCTFARVAFFSWSLPGALCA